LEALLTSPSHPRHVVPISRSAVRLGRLAAVGLNLMAAFGVVALVTGVLALRVQTRDLGDEARLDEIAAHNAALKVEMVHMNESMEELVDGLMETRVLAGMARSVIGLGSRSDSLESDILAVETPDVADLQDRALAEVMVSSAEQLDESLRQARELKAVFGEIVESMEARGDAWERIPSVGPLHAARLSSEFGLRRDPFTGRLALHKGIDLVAPVGTPVQATAKGRVTRAGSYPGYGLLVEIDHVNGLVTRYAHNARMAVRPGQLVRRGQVVGYVGRSGRASAPHVHYEVLLHGVTVNPEPYILALDVTSD
jgi:hypothetical protein